jgi:hypothetical protein
MVKLFRYVEHRLMMRAKCDMQGYFHRIHDKISQPMPRPILIQVKLAPR